MKPFLSSAKMNSTRQLALFRKVATGQFRYCSSKSPPKEAIPVDFYYDTISPYSWIGFEILLRYQKPWNLDIRYKPVFNAGLATLIENKLLASLKGHPNKMNAMFQDLTRIGEFAKIPFRMPESPFYLLAVVGSLKQQRFLTAVQRLFPEYVPALSRELWYRGWSEDMDIAKPESLIVIGRRAGLLPEEIEQCMRAMEEPETKKQLTALTKQAVEKGAPGLPYLVFHPDNEEKIEKFYGSDRFELIADKLGLKYKGPIPDQNSVHEMSMAPNQAELFLKLEQFDELNKNHPDSKKKIDPVDML